MVRNCATTPLPGTPSQRPGRICNRMSRKLAPLALLLTLALTACGKGANTTATTAANEPEPPAPNGAINLYPARHYDADLQLYRAFTKATGIAVKRREMEPDQLIERAKAEGQ